MKIMIRIVCNIVFVLTICFNNDSIVSLCSQEVLNTPIIPEQLKFMQIPVNAFIDVRYDKYPSTYGHVFFCEKIMTNKVKADTYYNLYKRRIGCYFQVKRGPYGYSNSDIDHPRTYRAFYAVLHDKDIFPLPGALFCRIKSDPKADYDAFLVSKKYYPEGVTVGLETLIIPFIPPQNDFEQSYLFGHFSVDKIEKNSTGKLHSKITYESQRDGKKPEGNMVTDWYCLGDVLKFHRAINVDAGLGAGAIGMSFDYWPELLQADSFGLRIVNIVPRDLYPMRVVGDKIKGRLIGWIELDSKIIPLDKDGKPLEQNKK
jgi:hypothetical protein